MLSSRIRPWLSGGALTVVLSSSLFAQGTAPLVSDLLRDVSQVESKFVALAQAMPADSYSWAPGEGVRSVGKVFQHVAADNYLIPAAVGVAAPQSTGIVGNDYGTATAYEERTASRDQIIADLQASFAFLKDAMSGTSAAGLSEQTTLFGSTFTKQQAWIMATTHLHEHLGQAIAYARSNGVVPPWSK
ncbi:MAG TPA: DinB family protein [Gemmatimonadaceae bacterium]|nr:DinB family protein [Gemmatimonadaceae bacterium]